MRLRTRLATGFVMLAACAAAASAQISLSSAVDLALRNDPRVKMSEASVKKAQASFDETYDVYVPTVSTNVGYGEGFGVPTSLPTIFSLSGNSLVFNFSQRDNIRAAASGLAAAKLALQEERAKVEEDVVVTYLNLDSDQRTQAAMNQEFDFAARLVSIVQDRLDAGQDTRLQLLRAQQTSKQIQLDKLELEDEIATLADRLSRMIRLPDNRLLAVSTSIPALPSLEAAAGSGVEPDSFGIQSAEANARSKQELAFGENRYRLRPQINLGVNYSRIDTGENDFTTYYPGFKFMSENAVGVGIQVSIPIFDKRHQDEANEASAEASRASFEAEDQRNQFLEGRFKLRHSALELSARSELAVIDRDLAQEQLNSVLAQLSATNANSAGPQMTPEDEQKARLDERARTIDVLNAQFQLSQTEVNLLRQTGQLDAWLKTAATAPDTISAPPVTP
jgi:outer membrane protein TolC